MLRGLAALEEVDLTAVVNVGDDETIYGLNVSPDIDTVIYTLAGVEGAPGWGLDGDSHVVMTGLEKFPMDSWFRIGDGDLSTNLFRTSRLAEGWTLSQVTTAQAAVFGVGATVLPATDDPVRTEIHLAGDGWISFQTYFVGLGHPPEIVDVRFTGAASAKPAPGVVDAIAAADLVLIGPSNPVLSIWPILNIEGIAGAIMKVERVVAVSPLFGGKPVKGPADSVMRALGLPSGTPGILAAYQGLIHELVVDTADTADLDLDAGDVKLSALPTFIGAADAATALASKIVDP